MLLDSPKASILESSKSGGECVGLVSARRVYTKHLSDSIAIIAEPQGLSSVTLKTRSKYA